MKHSLKINAKTITYIFSFILPITPWYFRIFGVSALNLFCLIYVFCGLLIRGKSISLKTLHPNSTVTILFLMWFLSKTVTFFTYGDYKETIWFLLRTIAVYVVFASSINTKESFLGVIKSILLASFFVGLFGIVEEITHFNVFSLLKPEDYELNYNPPRFGLLRILSFTEHTIVYSVYLMFCLCLCLYYLQFISKNKKIFYKLLYIILWINITLSLSRSAMICTFISQVIILYYSGKKEFLFRMMKIGLYGIITIVILSLISPKIASITKNLGYMILAVFNDDYTSVIASTFGGDNLHAQGDRIHLFKWVISEMDEGWVFGYGKDALFRYSYPMSNGIWNWTVIKENIEVQYLDVMYRYGVVGLITEVLLYLKILSISFFKKKPAWDKELSFKKTVFSILLMYYIQLFVVNQTTERNLFYIIVFMLLVYNDKEFRSKSTIEGRYK